MRDIALDLETMSIRLDGAIVGIGMVEFDLAHGTIGRTFFRPINLGDAVNNHGAKMDAATVTWWLTQSKAAQGQITTSCYSVRQALLDVAEFMADCCPIDDLKVWGKDPSFDQAMLQHLYNHLGLPVPWRFWNNRCIRTILAMHANVEAPEFVGEKHNAIDDATQSVQHMLKIREHVLRSRVK